MQKKESLNRTELCSVHESQGAKMVPFAGFLMPVWYQGLKEEHAAVRERVGVFDISHMGVLTISGDDAETFLQKVYCNDVNKCYGGKMVYGMILNHEGGILDDVMLGELDGTFYLVVNAANLEKLLAWFEPLRPDSVTITSRLSSHSFLAVQGPQAASSLTDVFDCNFQDKGRFSLTAETLLGHDCKVSRTGYTGEDGFELIVPNECVKDIWNTLMSAGLTPCGLGARDSLRLEAGLPLYGQELSEDINPLMTRYHGWVLKFDTNFIGSEPLRAIKDAGQTQTTVGLEMENRVIPRTGYAVHEGGVITSGTLSPTLNKPIAMAMVDVALAEPGKRVFVEIRGKLEPAVVVSLPFYKPA